MSLENFKVLNVINIQQSIANIVLKNAEDVQLVEV